MRQWANGQVRNAPWINAMTSVIFCSTYVHIHMRGTCEYAIIQTGYFFSAPESTAVNGSRFSVTSSIPIKAYRRTKDSFRYMNALIPQVSYVHVILEKCAAMIQSSYSFWIFIQVLDAPVSLMHSQLHVHNHLMSIEWEAKWKFGSKAGMDWQERRIYQTTSSLVG